MESTAETAARWAVRLDAGPLEPEERQQLDRWLAADARHLGAFVRARAQWLDLDRLAALHGPSSREGSAVSETPRIPEIRPAAGLSRRRWLAGSLAAALVAGVGLTWTLRTARHHVTRIGEVRRITLADGSTLILNTDSEVEVDLTADARRVRLVRGEAMFEIAHDAARPFVVQARGTAVRAIGTAFAVRLGTAIVDVTVTEGVVEIAPIPDARARASAAAAMPFAARRLHANERAVLRGPSAPPVVQRLAPEDANRRLAWRDGFLSFDGETLQQAAAELNRHNARQLVVADPVLAARPVIGVFRATDPEAFAAAAAATFAARSVATPSGIRLEPLSPAAASAPSE